MRQYAWVLDYIHGTYSTETDHLAAVLQFVMLAGDTEKISRTDVFGKQIIVDL